MPEASCHCGAIKITLAITPETLVQCTCSVCRRYGAQWAFLDTETTSVKAAPGSLVSYIWGDKQIAFQHCANCGCMTHYDSLSEEQPKRVAVNGRMLAAEVTQDLKLRTFDGAETWQFLD
ncbi:GFA family protein [Congregibacter sp.]|uniref:GFA family protein n=1 Tax=Congregibacter sp. TaxID=2744308 RepID=UPI00385D3A5A